MALVPAMHNLVIAVIVPMPMPMALMAVVFVVVAVAVAVTLSISIAIFVFVAMFIMTTPVSMTLLGENNTGAEREYCYGEGLQPSA